MSDETTNLSRREFIRTTVGTASGAVAAATILQASGPVAGHAPAVNPRIIGANDRVNVGVIGVKGMGGGHLRNIVGDPMADDNGAVIAVCDVWEDARRKAQTSAKCPDSQVYSDYRKLLANKDVDAVIVATPDHWHGRISVDALTAGKHVYVEKPMTRHLDEAFAIHDAAKRTKRLVQVGSHGCSDPKYHRARDLITSGTYGRLLWAQGSYCRNNPNGEWNYKLEPEATAQSIDWQTWLGPAPKRAFSAERFFRWRKYWDYGTGIIGDLWPHRLHPLMLAMGINEFPASVSCIGGDLCKSDTGTDASGQPKGEPREVADTTLMMVEFASGAMIMLAGSTVNERGVDDVIRLQKANMTLGGVRVAITPERPYVDELDAIDESPENAGESHVKHMRNFFEAIRGEGALTCNEDLGVRVQAIVSMAELAYRKKKLARFDEKTRQILV
ncbi:MAG TPA: Gfo/Idh/MocA family oxidoreductase [Vicinamibacterales bacterium]|nr:Gfo/Idh/MocA family oxidoreductase [Vicinamibacterales bacterium]